MQSRSSQPDVRTPRTLRGAVEPETIALTDSETYQTLLARAHRRTGGVPSESIVRHVLSVTRGGDWPVARDALDAVLRRCASTHTDDIQIAGRPRGRLLGLYATRGLRARPYRTLLRRIEPLDGSCECADFLGTHSACASTSSLSSRRWSRRGLAGRSSAKRPPTRRRCAGIRSGR